MVIIYFASNMDKMEQESLMSNRRDWIFGLGIAGVTLLLIFFVYSLNMLRQNGKTVKIRTGGEKVALVELEGAIYNARPVVRQFDHYRKQKAIKAIVFRINSPGGGVVPSQEIYEAVKRARDSGKPVVASLGTVAASGGYYVACPADTIVANPGTTTGSIGVIAEFLNMQELLDKIGIRINIIKSGRYKDIGSMHRPMTPEEQKLLQAWVDDTYYQFVDAVALERGLSRKQVLKFADGRVVTGRQAVRLKLVDVLGDYETAIDLAAEMAGIEGEPTIVKLRERHTSVFDLVYGQLGQALHHPNRISVKYLFSP